MRPWTRAEVFGLAALCIAVFECSQLVFHSTHCPYWAVESSQVAAAGFDAETGGGIELSKESVASPG